MAMLLFSKVYFLKSKRAGRSEASRGPKKQKSRGLICRRLLLGLSLGDFSAARRQTGLISIKPIIRKAVCKKTVH